MEKKRITILATGGTIAGRAPDAEAVTGYAAGTLPAEALVAAVPGLGDVADIRVEEFCAIDSKDMTGSIWRGLAARVNALEAEESVDGIVITHGTDTLEETAFFLSLTTRGEKPVVLTAAMRPATAISADGPMNLLDAVKTAAEGDARGRGVLVVMDDAIFSARDVRKTHTLSLHTFQSDLGPLGRVEGGRVCWYRREEGGRPRFTLPAGPLPKVYILYGHAGADGVLTSAAVEAGAAGLVYAGTGNGSIHAADEVVLAEAVRKGIPVVRASHVGAGPVVAAEASYEAHGFLSAGILSPQKARILLQLALAAEEDPAEAFGML